MSFDHISDINDYCRVKAYNGLTVAHLNDDLTQSCYSLGFSEIFRKSTDLSFPKILLSPFFNSLSTILPSDFPFGTPWTLRSCIKPRS